MQGISIYFEDYLKKIKPEVEKSMKLLVLLIALIAFSPIVSAEDLQVMNFHLEVEDSEVFVTPIDLQLGEMGNDPGAGLQIVLENDRGDLNVVFRDEPAGNPPATVNILARRVWPRR